jgi:hypothetical protein
MKTYKYLILTIILLGLSACKKDDLPEYPGSLIVHGLVNIEMPGSDINNPDLRMYAFSGSHTEDLSSLPEGDWTYELWIKVAPDALIGNKDARNGLYAGGACIGDRRHNFELYLINDPDADYAIKYGKLQTGNDNQIASMQSDGAAENLHFDEWVHVAISRSSTDGIAKFYINGKLIDSSNDTIWIQAQNDTWLDFNYMYRGSAMHFFKGGMDNIRLSKVDRYPTEFTPVRSEPLLIDNNTLLQLNLDEQLRSFSPANNFDKIDVQGTYDYYIKVHNTNTWHHEPDEYLPLGDYK